MAEESFTEVTVSCPSCGHNFPIMVHSDRGSTVTICEECLEHLEVDVQDGEVAEVQVTA